MGAALDALGTGVDITVENPTYVVVTFLALIGMFLVSLIFAIIPLLGPVLQTIVVIPAFLTIVLGMAFGGLVDGDASLEAGLESLKTNYLSLAGAYGFLMVAAFAVTIGAVLLAAVIGAFVIGLGSTAGEVANPGALSGLSLAAGGLTLLFFLVFSVIGIAIAFVVQFVDVAIIVGGESATSTFRAAYRLVKSDPISVIGYTLLRAAAGLTAGFGVTAGIVVGEAASSEAGALVLGAGAAIVILPITYAFLFAYHVAYYDERMGNRTTDEGADVEATA